MKRQTATTQKTSESTPEKKTRKRRVKRSFTAEQKCRAVLSLWTLDWQCSGHLPGSRDQLQPTGQVADASLRSNGGSAEAESQRVQSDSFESRIQRLLARIERTQSP